MFRKICSFFCCCSLETLETANQQRIILENEEYIVELTFYNSINRARLRKWTRKQVGK